MTECIREMWVIERSRVTLTSKTLNRGFNANPGQNLKSL